jgi:putative pyruvate formate lyase activating enzyme
MAVMRRAAYAMLPAGELRRRAERALGGLADCRACPRDCRVNRLEDRWSACKTGRHAVVSSYFAHFGEEDCLRGTRGSGTIFFAHCNLRCVFCQNFEISQGLPAGPAVPGLPAASIAQMMLELQRQGCHNINLVTPEHVVPQVLEALDLAARRGLTLPLVYNTSAYDALDSLRLLDGIVDIYMPDLKCWSREFGKRFLLAGDYAEAARAAILEMHRQVGPLVLDRGGLARRGLLIRHLMMPGGSSETRAILEWIARELGTETFINLMEQYHPAGKVSSGRYPALERRPSRAEIDEAYRVAQALGLRRLAG